MAEDSIYLYDYRKVDELLLVGCSKPPNALAFVKTNPTNVFEAFRENSFMSDFLV